MLDPTHETGSLTSCTANARLPVFQVMSMMTKMTYTRTCCGGHFADGDDEGADLPGDNAVAD